VHHKWHYECASQKKQNDTLNALPVLLLVNFVFIETEMQMGIFSFFDRKSLEPKGLL